MTKLVIPLYDRYFYEIAFAYFNIYKVLVLLPINCYIIWCKFEQSFYTNIKWVFGFI